MWTFVRRLSVPFSCSCRSGQDGSEEAEEEPVEDGEAVQDRSPPAIRFRSKSSPSTFSDPPDDGVDFSVRVKKVAAMSVRGWRIWRRSNNALGIVVESTQRRDVVLVLHGNAVFTRKFDDFDEERRFYEKICDGYGLMGVLRLSQEESVLIVVTGVVSLGKLIEESDILRVTATQFIPLRTVGATGETVDSRIPGLQRLISSGAFYFSSSPKYDLTLSAQRRASADSSTDSRFFWNRPLHFPLERFGIDPSDWLLKCMSGSVLVRTVYIGAIRSQVAVISRLSCERVGTRFNVRGANDVGAVANFVETEQLILFEGQESSFVQIRGSIPLFWDQPGVQVGSHKVKLRAFEASAPAYHRHFYQLRKLYDEVVIVNLLGRKEGEKLLSDAFQAQHKKSTFSSDVPMIDFDYHAQMKAGKDNIEWLRKQLGQFAERFGFFHSKDGVVTRKQSGVIRTNCLDCLDRTNCVQSMLGIYMIHSQLDALQFESTNNAVFQRFEAALREVWQKNGDQCSLIYAGTGALEGKSKLKDASRSLARTIQNNLMDSSKQESFDLFLAGSLLDPLLADRAANLLPVSLIQDSFYFREYGYAVESLLENADSLTSSAPLTIFVGTWNVNGGKNMHNIAFRNEAKLSDWLFPDENLVTVNSLDALPDIVAIGLEEIVDLNAGNIVKAGTTNQRLWGDGIRKTLLEKAPYVLLACEQLVGVCLFIFARARLTPFLKDFVIASLKTGLGGATGNKGSVACRMVVHSTSVVFVCSHFAAGQNEVRDRNDDYVSTVRKLHFSGGRSIEAHDVIFWFGDFNYRISGLGGEEVKRAVRANQLEICRENDQLAQQKAIGSTFVGFSEGPLSFPPTYKYDTFSDDYDTSEKCRTPAWTDRVLWKEAAWRGVNIVQLQKYGRSELKTSDHRPVYAVFTMDARAVEWGNTENIVEDVVSGMGPPDGTVICSLQGYSSSSEFPAHLVEVVIDKVHELHENPMAHKLDGSELWLIFDSGVSALAALSMDGVKLSSTVTLSVQLKSPNWSEEVRPRLAAHDPSSISIAGCDESNVADASSLFNFDEDDEELVLVPQAPSLSARQAPERPRPPSARSAVISNGTTPPIPSRTTSGVSLANLDWPSDPTPPSSHPLSASFSNTFSNSLSSSSDFASFSANLSASSNGIPAIPPRPSSFARFPQQF